MELEYTPALVTPPAPFISLINAEVSVGTAIWSRVHTSNNASGTQRINRAGVYLALGH